MKLSLRKAGVIAAGTALLVSGLSMPASSAATANAITMADSQAGSVGVQQIATPWFNSGALSQVVMFRGLLRAMPDQTTYKPDLASSYKVSKDGKTITFTLKSGLKWSDGQPITTDDVVWSVNQVLRVAVANANYINSFKQIVGASAVNATSATNMSGLTASGNTITFQLTAPQSLFIPILAQFMILPKHSLAKEDPLTLHTNAFWKNPVTSGPFKVGTLSAGNFITLVPNTYYEGDKPSITQINVVSSVDPVSDAKAGKIDYFYSNDPEIAKAMAKVSTFQAYPTNAIFYRYFVFNLLPADSPFKNIKARQALEYGVNWASLVALVYTKNAKVINSGVLTGLPYHLTSIPTYKYDPAQAKQLLKDANFDFSKTVRLRWYNADQNTATFMAGVAQAMTDLGMKVDAARFQADGTTELYTIRQYDLALKGLSAFAVNEWYSEYSNPATFEKIIGPQPDFAALNLALSQAVGRAATGKALTDLQTLEQKNLYKLPLHSLKQVVYVSKRISGLTTFGNPLYIYDNNFANWVAG